MSEFNAQDFTYSYSSINSYITCPLGFKRTYVDKIPRAGNFFALFGNILHKTMEEYFADNLEIFELKSYFEQNYDKYITIDPPPYPPNMEQNYLKQTHKFLDDCSIDKYDYEVIGIETKYNITWEGINLVVKPDLLLRRKSDKKVVLWDWKTSKYDKKKHSGYSEQLIMYAYFINKISNVVIDELGIHYVREEQFRPIEYNEENTNNVLDTIKNTVELIRKDTEWKPNPDEFYCSWLCSSRNKCPFRKMKVF